MVPPERIAAFGPLGTYLADVISAHDEWDRSWSSDGLVADLVKVQRFMVPGRDRNAELAAAGSLLLLEYPVQVDLTQSEWRGIWTAALRLPLTLAGFEGPGGSLAGLFSQSAGKVVNRLVADRGLRREAFPYKAHIAGETKQNVQIAPLLESFRRVHGCDRLVGLLRATAGRITADRLAGLLVYTAALDCYGQLGDILAVRLTLDVDAAKALSMATKALGLNSRPWGCVLCEANTLAGRFYGGLDLAAEARKRTVDADIRPGLVNLGAEDLRSHVRAIIWSELDSEVRLPPLDEFWTSRWAWCVNGSHTAQSSRALGLDPKFLAGTHERVYRRAASENTPAEPLTEWDGNVYVSPSEKLEHGKTRAIFSCDTRSYFAFSWLLGAVQKRWRNSRVILDPGSAGHLGIVRRLTNAQRGGGVNLMLDYDDFNSQHSNEVMAMVFEELCDRVRAPPWYRAQLAGSFFQTYLLVDGQWRKSAGTLMSGHRATTIINSVLNAAYIRAGMGGPEFDRSLSLHTGDDVFFRCNTLADCVRILKGAKAIGCRLNPTKQSIGWHGAEFLRVGVRNGAGYGYAARSIASFVSGNWTTDGVPQPRDALGSAILGCRSLLNRGCAAWVCDVIAPALRHVKGVGIRVVVRLLRGTACLDGGVVYGGSGPIPIYEAVGGTAEVEGVRGAGWKTHATTDFLTRHCSEVERAGIELAGVDVVSRMVASSYEKGLDQRNSTLRRPPLRLRKLAPCVPVGYADAKDLLTRGDPGVLAKFPLLQLVKSSLDNRQVSALLALVGYNVRPAEAREVAFGPERTATRVIGVLSYSDAAMMGGRTRAGHIYTTHHCHV
ncbi:MAG: RNA-dependent RNA polymerase [Fushun totivirus 2]|nr:MAG: RNA-dependent RNA polymerase [Fushun totivirus 2]WGU15423.1 RdRp [Sogatella furcifera toti-like virus 1]